MWYRLNNGPRFKPLLTVIEIKLAPVIIFVTDGYLSSLLTAGSSKVAMATADNSREFTKESRLRCERKPVSLLNKCSPPSYSMDNYLAMDSNGQLWRGTPQSGLTASNEVTQRTLVAKNAKRFSSLW